MNIPSGVNPRPKRAKSYRPGQAECRSGFDAEKRPCPIGAASKSFIVAGAARRNISDRIGVPLRSQEISSSHRGWLGAKPVRARPWSKFPPTRWAQKTGQATVEFLFAFSVFFGLFLAAYQVIDIINAKSLVNLAAFYAAHEYATTHSEDDATKAARWYANLLLDKHATNISVYIDTPDGIEYGRTCEARVVVYYHLLPFQLVRNWFPARPAGGGPAGTIRLESNSVMFIEGSS